MKTYVGIDLGGTNVRVAKITADGEVLYQEKSPSYGQEGPEKVMANLKAMISRVPDLKECSGIGIGVPGPCDTVRNVMLMSSNLPGFTEYPIADELTAEFGLPTFIDNDANVAGLAEALVGAGKGLPVVYYVTISTGIGGALCVDGKVVSGAVGHAGEIANIIIDRNRKKINHLNVGAVENEASGTAVTRRAQEAMPEEHIAHAGQVFDMAAAGNEKAKEIVNDVVEDLAVMFSVIAHVCDPNMFVIGGGMLKSKEHFLPQTEARFKELIHAPMRQVKFVTSELEEPGIIGAAMLPVSHGL